MERQGPPDDAGDTRLDEGNANSELMGDEGRPCGLAEAKQLKSSNGLIQMLYTRFTEGRCKWESETKVRWDMSEVWWKGSCS